jgi:hypothetical protein
VIRNFENKNDQSNLEPKSMSIRRTLEAHMPAATPTQTLPPVTILPTLPPSHSTHPSYPPTRPPPRTARVPPDGTRVSVCTGSSLRSSSAKEYVVSVDCVTDACLQMKVSGTLAFSGRETHVWQPGSHDAGFLMRQIAGMEALGSTSGKVANRRRPSRRRRSAAEYK